MALIGCLFLQASYFSFSLSVSREKVRVYYRDETLPVHGRNRI